jgi:hypothetical protein
MPRPQTVYVSTRAEAVRIVRKVKKLGGVATTLRMSGKGTGRNVGKYPVLIYSLPGSVLRNALIVDRPSGW